MMAKDNVFQIHHKTYRPGIMTQKMSKKKERKERADRPGLISFFLTGRFFARSPSFFFRNLLAVIMDGKMPRQVLQLHHDLM
jgi:hypothetical protein